MRHPIGNAGKGGCKANWLVGKALLRAVELVFAVHYPGIHADEVSDAAGR